MLVMLSLGIFAYRLREARKSKYSSQEALAECLNVHPLTVGRWERGERLPSPQDLDKLTVTLDRPLAWFFSEISAEADDLGPVASFDAIRANLDNLEKALSSLMRQQAGDEITWTDEMVHKLLRRVAETGKVHTLDELRELKNVLYECTNEQ